ncbi:hypothetical protein [Neorhodopirellula pilleata]|uniref:hypothetical protein n=1 Tax=Neorhodopirellula pilleata TaxID=2714738 RepID=UPI001E4ADA72
MIETATDLSSDEPFAPDPMVGSCGGRFSGAFRDRLPPNELFLDEAFLDEAFLDEAFLDGFFPGDFPSRFFESLSGDPTTSSLDGVPERQVDSGSGDRESCMTTDAQKTRGAVLIRLPINRLNAMASVGRTRQTRDDDETKRATVVANPVRS